MERVDEIGVERVEGTGIVGSEGKRVDTFVCLLLTMAFLTGCNILNTTFDGGFVSPFEGRCGTACAGGGFGDEQAAGDKGEREIVFVANLLTTSFFIDCIGLGTVRNDGLALFIKG